MVSIVVGLLVASFFLLFFWRTCIVLAPPSWRPPPRRRAASEPCSLAVFLGSGGHTTEMLTLVSALDFARYTPRTYILSAGDTLSADKALALERAKAIAVGPRDAVALPPQKLGAYTIIEVPRARRVGQSLFTTPFGALASLARCVHWLAIAPLFSDGPPPPDVLLLNGPGTSVVLALAVLINRFFGLPSPRIVYIESFARVRSLSLSGRLLQPVVDSFIVQWPEALAGGRKGICHGWLV